MRQNRMEGRGLLKKVVCNQCGRELKLEEGYLREGCYEGQQVFGYFSRKDGLRHKFDLCEECYDKWISGFIIPVEEEEISELL